MWCVGWIGPPSVDAGPPPASEEVFGEALAAVGRAVFSG